MFTKTCNVPTPLDDSSQSFVNEKSEGGSETFSFHTSRQQAYQSSEVTRTTGVTSIYLKFGLYEEVRMMY